MVIKYIMQISCSANLFSVAKWICKILKMNNISCVYKFVVRKFVVSMFSGFVGLFDSMSWCQLIYIFFIFYIF